MEEVIVQSNHEVDINLEDNLTPIQKMSSHILSN